MKKNYKKFILVIAILIILQSITMLLVPILLSIWQVKALNKYQFTIILITLLLSVIVNLSLIYKREKFAKDYNVLNFMNLFSKFIDLDYKVLVKEGSTNIIERIIMCVNSWYSYMTGDNVRIFSSIITILLILLMVLFTNFYVFLILLLTVLINVYSYRHINKVLKHRSKYMQETSSKGWQNVLSIIKNPDFIKSQSSFTKVKNLVKKPVLDVYSSISDLNIYAQSTSSLIDSFNNIVKILIMVFILFISSDSNIKSNILFFTIITPLFFGSLSTITSINLSKVDFNTSNDFISFLDNNKENKEGIKIDKIDKIKIKLNSIKINADVNIDYNINENIKKGDIVWIKGKSGKGKSTIAKSLIGIFEPENIYLNGIDINKINKNDLRNLISYIPQEASIFNTSLLNNLLIDDPSKIKFTDNFLLRSILKYKSLDQEISDNASNISGGEKQKIALARALQDNSNVLILDEVTSNIDKKSSNDILESIIKLSNDKIIFIISHDNLDNKFYNRIIEI